MLLKEIKKALNRHPEAFQKQITASDIVSETAATLINTRINSDSRGLNKLVSVFWEVTVLPVTLFKQVI